jgi:hypothetical protein
MLEIFYNTFGFFGAILIAFLGFSIFICWIAGIAGIAYLPESKNRTLKLVLSIIFPPYPFFWLLYDIYQERKLMQEED